MWQARCKDRFVILEHWVEDGTQGLHWCKVEFLRDTPEADPTSVTAISDSCKETFRRFVYRCGEAARSEINATYGPMPDDPEVFHIHLSSTKMV